MFSTRLFDLGTFAFGPLTKNRSRRRSGHQLESHAEVLEQRLVLSAVTGAASDGGHIATVEGVAEVDGRDLHVEVMVWVPAGGDADEITSQALREYCARKITASAFSTTGLQWSQFDVLGNGDDFVTQHYNPSNDPFAGESRSGEEIWTAAQDTWDAVATSTFAFAQGTTTSRSLSLVKESPGKQTADTFNDFAWMPLRGRTTLGVTWTDFANEETDVAINTNFDWFDTVFTSGGFDAQTVILHEYGHVLGLGHSTEVGSVMEAVYDGVRQDLHDDDEAGITFLYGGPTTPADAPPTVTIASPLDGASVAVGDSIDLIAEAPTLWMSTQS